MGEDCEKNERVDFPGNIEIVAYSWNIEVVNSLASGSIPENSYEDIEMLGCLHGLSVYLWNLGSCDFGNFCHVRPWYELRLEMFKNL